MPVVSRKFLRQTLGQAHLRDTYVGNTTASWSQTGFSLNIIDANLADLGYSGQGLYAGTWVWMTGMTSPHEVRVASFNVQTGTLLSQTKADGFPPTPSGVEYERHDVLSPTDKGRAIDEAVKRLRVRREVAVWSVDGLHAYTLPAEVEQVLSGYYFANPAASLDRGRGELASVETVLTPTGVEVRIDPALGASQQLVLDAVTTLTLGAADAATVNIPDERLVLYGAEAVCWDLLVRRAPRGTAPEYRALRDEAARQYADLAKRFKTPVDRPLRIGP